MSSSLKAGLVYGCLIPAISLVLMAIVRCARVHDLCLAKCHTLRWDASMLTCMNCISGTNVDSGRTTECS